MSYQREHLGWSTAQKQEWGLFLLECILHNVATMWRKEYQRCSWGSKMAESAPEHPSMWTILGSPWFRDPKVEEHVYRAECVIAPSILSHSQQDECIRELCQELTRCMTRAGLQSKTGPARPSSRSQRCSHSHSTSKTWCLLAGSQGQSHPSN